MHYNHIMVDNIVVFLTPLLTFSSSMHDIIIIFTNLRIIFSLINWTTNIQCVSESSVEYMFIISSNIVSTNANIYPTTTTTNSIPCLTNNDNSTNDKTPPITSTLEVIWYGKV